MRKISIKIYIFSLVLWQINVFSQNAVSVGPFKEEQPKNEEIILQNENVKIPLYTIKTGNIIYPIDLIYNIGGIAVDQVAEAIGLGWQLSDSYIYREVEDKIDVDEPNGGNYPTYSATGYEGHTNVMHSSTIQELKKKGYQNVKTNSITEHFNTNIGLLDHAPDIFNLNSLFFNTTFYFPDSKTSAKELYGNNTIISPEIGDILINYTDDKRQVYQGPLLANNRVFQDYKKFTIKQNNGIVSIFDEPDYVHIINFVRNTIGPNYGLYYPNKFDLYNSPTTEKWHLSSIIDPLTNRTVSFSYQTFSTEDDHINTFANFQNKNKPYLREGVFYKYNFNL